MLTILAWQPTAARPQKRRSGKEEADTAQEPPAKKTKKQKAPPPPKYVRTYCISIEVEADPDTKEWQRVRCPEEPVLIHEDFEGRDIDGESRNTVQPTQNCPP